MPAAERWRSGVGETVWESRDLGREPDGRRNPQSSVVRSALRRMSRKVPWRGVGNGWVDPASRAVAWVAGRPRLRWRPLGLGIAQLSHRELPLAAAGQHSWDPQGTVSKHVSATGAGGAAPRRSAARAAAPARVTQQACCARAARDGGGLRAAPQQRPAHRSGPRCLQEKAAHAMCCAERPAGSAPLSRPAHAPSSSSRAPAAAHTHARWRGGMRAQFDNNPPKKPAPRAATTGSEETLHATPAGARGLAHGASLWRCVQREGVHHRGTRRRCGKGARVRRGAWSASAALARLQRERLAVKRRANQRAGDAGHVRVCA